MLARGEHRSFQQSAFTLVELVIVVTIIGILAAIAVPRLVSASGAASEKALEATLTNVRKAIDIYYAEHGKYPGYVPGTNSPDGKAFKKQLTLYSNRNGLTAATYAAPYIYGPYLRAPFPTNPTNNLDTVHMKVNPTDADPAAGSVGWIAVLSSGSFALSATNTGLVDLGILDGTVKARLLLGR